MRWISEDHVYSGKSYKIEGWHLNDPKDYDTLIHCKRCGTKTPIKECRRDPTRGYLGDTVAAPIFEISCPQCLSWLGTLDESDQKWSAGPVPFLTLQNEKGELYQKPS